MSSAIRDVSETLVELLRSNVGIVPPETIGLVSPAEADEVGGVLLGLWLYSIMPAAEYRNELEVYGDRELGEPRVQVVDLYYLLTAYPAEGDNPTERTLNTQHVLGRAMRVLFDNGLLSGSVLRGALPRDQELRLTFQPMTVEDLTRIFGVFPDNPLETSVSYVVTPVKIDVAGRAVEQPRVVLRQTDVDHAMPLPRQN